MSITLPYLFQQGKKNTWYYLRRIPNEILGTVEHEKYFDGKSRIKKSLKTTVLQLALPEYYEIALDFENNIALARGKKIVSPSLEKMERRAIKRLSEKDLKIIKKNFFMRQVSPVETLIRKAKEGDPEAVTERLII